MWRSATALLCTLLLMTAAPAGQVTPADTTEPSVRITSPSEDQVVSGSVAITADAVDDSGVAGVTFEVDGEAIGVEDTTEPWSAVWNTAASGAGAHILTVIARDTVGNAVRSAVVAVVVNGSAPPPFPPPTNHQPVAGPDSLTSVERARVTFTGAYLLANDTDEDGHALAITNVADASSEGGSIVSIGGGSWTYTPASTFAGLDTFTYSIADASGGVASGTVTVNVTAPSDDGLVLALGFDENMGLTAFDGSGRNHHGAISGAERVSGKIGGALRFDGVDDWVTVADAPGLDLSSGMTLEAWVKPSGVAGWNTVLLKEGAGNMAYELYANNPDIARPAGYFTTPGGGLRGVTGTAALQANVWTHLAVTYDGASMRLYVNGALARTVARTGAIVATNGPLHIGGNEVWGGEWFTGLLDEVRIYNRALSATEIKADMSGSTLPEPPPNSAPVAQNDALATEVGSPVSFTAASLLANDNDANGDPITVTSMAVTSVAGGTVAGSGVEAWTYTPPASFSGTDSFTYVIEDGRGGSASGKVNVTVAASAPPPPAAGIVLALGFNESAGSTVASDASGRGHNGSVLEAQFVPGRFGNALSFDGVNDWVTVADAAALDLSSAMTLEAWVKPTSVAGWRTVLLKEGAGNMAYEMYANNPDVSRPAAYFTTAGGTLRAATGTSVLPANAWTHLAVTYDGTNMRLYVNGVLVRDVLRAGTIMATTGPLHIGGNQVWGGEFFAGLIDEVRIYNRALSAAEIGADMTTPIP
jgi:hypothetical protein